ncbi:MAG: hypothetical protein WA395_14375 [Nitrososphaeraceae archaeon]
MILETIKWSAGRPYPFKVITKGDIETAAFLAQSPPGISVITV